MGSIVRASGISAFIICFNEEVQIRRALESVKWCDEVVVVDSGSSDSTLAICKEYTDKIFHRDWTGYVDQKQFGLDQCNSEWVLNIDADEEVSPELRAEIQSLLGSNIASNIDGFLICRVVFYLNRWWRSGGWYPEYRLRLCRREKTVWKGNDPHEKASVTGNVQRLKGELYHYTYSDISDQINRLNKFSSSAAATLLQAGERPSIVKLILRPIGRFFKFYLLKQGFRDGLPGFTVALLEAYYVYLKYVKLWELVYIKKNQ